MKTKLFVIIVLFTFICGFGFAEEGRMNPQISKGIEYHNLTREDTCKDVAGIIEKCLDTLEPFVSSDALACAYYGSAKNIKARTLAEKNPIKSLSYLEEGSSYLDKAVSMKSDEIELRIIRLENGIEVSRSSPIKRYSVICEDVDFILEKNNVSQLPAQEKAEAYLYCGFYYQDAGDLETALDLFEMSVEADGDSAAGKAAQNMLDKYSE